MRHALMEPVGAENQGIGALSEPRRRRERLAVLAPLQRLRMLEEYFFGRPSRPQAMPKDIHEHAEREFGILSALHDAAVNDAVFQTHQLALARKTGLGRLLMIGKQAG